MASYLIDESELTLSLHLPVNLPLSPVEMIHSEQSGVTPRLWEGWRKGVSTILDEILSVC